MTNRGQIIRSSTKGAVPAAATRAAGELWTNFPDKQLGVIDTARTAQPLVAVRYFSTGADYAIGDYVVQAGQLYRAKTAVTAGAFNATQWTLTGGSVLVSATAPATPTPGDMWFDANGGQLYVYYDDGNTAQWVVAVNQNVAGGVYLPLTGGTLTGPLTIGVALPGTAALTFSNTAGAAAVVLDAPSSQFRNIQGRSSGSLRWSMALGDNSGETGSNAGSNFTLTSMSDDLSTISTPFSISRANSNVTFISTVNISNPNNAALLNLNAPVAQPCGIFGQKGGLSRWSIQPGTGGAESGSNSGSDFGVYRYTDAGALIDGPLLINRANGTMTATGSFYCTSGSMITMSKGAGNNAQLTFADNTGTGKGVIYWNSPTGAIQLTHFASSVSIFLDTNGFNANTPLRGKGSSGLQGAAGGSYGNVHNWFWSGGLIQAWIDTTNAGNLAFTSDYRTKKDVEDLPSTWETLKALRPIKYTQAEFSPPSHVEFVAQEQAKAREIAEADPEAAPREVSDAPMFEADEHERWGFLAHELQETLVPSASSGVKDSPDTIQCPNPWTVIATLTKALQEAMTRIEALEAQSAGAR